MKKTKNKKREKKESNRQQLFFTKVMCVYIYTGIMPFYISPLTKTKGKTTALHYWRVTKKKERIKEKIKI